MKFYEIEKMPLDSELETSAWVRYIRKGSSVKFLQCFDGTSDVDLQFVIAKDLAIDLRRGDFIKVKATKVTSQGTQDFELKVQSLELMSKPKIYPMEKRDASIETLRAMPQWRTKTKSLSAVMKLRSHLELAISQYFSEKSFIKISPPLISPSDCEGAGEVFSLGESFFKKQAFLTVSSQMYLEAMTRSFSQVYCLAPAFRADPSLSPRHLAEFWMLESEFLTEDVHEVIGEALALIKFCGQFLLTKKELLKEISPDLEEKLKIKLGEEFKIISYEEATLLLGKDIEGSKEEKRVNG